MTREKLTAKLYNRGPHRVCFRGDVELHSDGRMTWTSSGLDVQQWHNDFAVGTLDQCTRTAKS